MNLVFIFLIIFILLSTAAITIRLLHGTSHSVCNDERFDPLPALNYFQSGEPDYFFYDPIIIETDSKGKRYIPKNVRQRKGKSQCTDNQCIIGPDNYVRYNIQDIKIMDSP